MKFGELWNKICGDNKISWWYIENHEDKGILAAELTAAEVPKRIWNSEVVRIGAEGNKIIDVGLKEEEK
jgi:hypothetical protein